VRLSTTVVSTLAQLRDNKDGEQKAVLDISPRELETGGRGNGGEGGGGSVRGRGGWI
jgi:hypothetical protein